MHQIAPDTSLLPRPQRLGRWTVGWLAVAVVGSLTARLAADEKPGIRVPPGFEVSLYADDDLAHDIYSMTVDSLGRVVVSGAGYVRILIDEDGDGRADSFRQFADGPQSGAQGMVFHGRDLLCTGDEGLIRYRDRNGDDRADGKPDVFLKIKTGGEHHAHAVRRGPDGWWYLIAGNFAEVTGKYATLPTSPIRRPAAGPLMRFKPDLSGGEIVADGYRNAYDFAFHTSGDVFVYDSDGERDVSLPWYRPTRIFQALPGSNAGWVSRSWKRPADYADMPPALASFGRGSPTGVTCYRHHRFPEKYRGALFVLDWTFGRVMALPLRRDGSVWQSDPETFMTGIGQFGFAPTDAVIAPDGSLLVSVGGRGTRGSVYRVRYVGDENLVAAAGDDAGVSKLNACLDAPQPLSSWSRAAWVPLAKKLGRSAFLEVALDDRQPTETRIRAIEILTDLFDGLGATALLNLSISGDVEVRARAAWSAGRTGVIARRPQLLLPFLNDTDPLVVRCALETLIGQPDPQTLEPLYAALARQLGAEDRFVRQTAARVVSQLPQNVADELAKWAAGVGMQTELSIALGRTMRESEFNAPAVAVGLKALKGNPTAQIALEAARLIQLGLGDIGPRDKRPPVFDGYAPAIDLSAHRRQVDRFGAELASVYPTGEAALDAEISRGLAMIAPDDAALLERVLRQINDQSDPIADIHQLIVAARIPASRRPAQSRAIAAALIGLDEKIAARGLNQDSNWEPRIGEMYKELGRLDPALPQRLLEQPGFGRPGHVLYLSEFAEEDLDAVVAAFVKRIAADPDYPWNNDVIFLLGASNDPAHRQLIRDQYESYAVRSAVLIVLAKRPQPTDRDKFVEGLSSSQLPVLTACVEALAKLPSSAEPAEQFALLRTLRRLGENKAEFGLREKVVRLLRRNLDRQFGFQFGKAGHTRQAEAIGRWTEFLSGRYPQVAAGELGGGGADLSQLKTMLAEVDWEQGDAVRGKALFEKRSCIQCHGGRQALGPDLAGAARRFSRDDLFIAIALPNRDVSPRYQTTLIESTEGKVYTGLIIYESVDGLLLRNAANQTFRIESDEIEMQQKRPTSLMPAGLLKDLKPGDLADLYRYLSGL